MDLKSYLKKQKISQKDFAEQVGCKQPVISQICNGKRPGMRLAIAISKGTNNAVKIQDLVKL